VTIEGHQTRNTEFEGFTVTGGQHGIYVYAGSPVIRGNVVSGNNSTVDGGGILCAGTTSIQGHPLITQNTIEGNYAARLGGGVLCTYVTADISLNQILNNRTGSGDGGGVYYARGNSGGTIAQNFLRGNEAGDKGGGVYVHGDLAGYFVVVELNIFCQNTARGVGYTGLSGGGLCLARSNALVARNTIVECGAPGHLNSYGGGIGIYNVGNNTIEENIVAFSSSGGGILCVSGATPIIRNNLAWENNGGDGLGDCATWWQGDGNVVTDPMFCGRSTGDFSLANVSPAFTHPEGPLGALPTVGCTATPVQPTTWGRLKTLY
jgi:predicted outer membrane repeat protein